MRIEITAPIDRGLTLNALIRKLLNCAVQARSVKQASAIYYAQKKKLEKAVQDAVDSTIVPKEPLEAFQVVCVWKPRDRRLDPIDNIVTTLKPVFDSLVELGVIMDDSPKHVYDTIVHCFDYGAKTETVTIHLVDHEIITVAEILTRVEAEETYDTVDWSDI